MASLPVEYAVRNLGRRPLRTFLTAISSALVATVLTAVTCFVRGLEVSFSGAAREDTAILLSAVSERDVVRSTVPQAVADLVAADVAAVKKIDGVPAVSPEIHMGTNVRLGPRPAGDAVDPIRQGFLRGVTDRAYLVHDRVTLVRGNLPGPGEVIVGRLAAQQMAVDDDDLSIGKIIRFEGGEFRIAGVFAAPGTTIESEIWVDLREIQGLSKRDDVSIVFVRLERPDLLNRLDLFTKRRLDLELIAIPSAVYYRELTDYFSPIKALAWGMALLIAAAAMFAGANTANAAIQDRLKELATLGTIGYPLGAIMRSLLTEAVILAAAGGLAGLFFARLGISGGAVRIAMSAFRLEVDSTAILVGFAGVLLLGLLGTIPAAWRILRLPIAAALKET